MYTAFFKNGFLMYFYKERPKVIIGYPKSRKDASESKFLY